MILNLGESPHWFIMNTHLKPAELLATRQISRDSLLIVNWIPARCFPISYDLNREIWARLLSFSWIVAEHLPAKVKG